MTAPQTWYRLCNEEMHDTSTNHEPFHREAITMKNPHANKNVHHWILRIATRVSQETIDNNTKAEVIESLCEAYCCAPAFHRSRLLHLRRAYQLLEVQFLPVPSAA